MIGEGGDHLWVESGRKRKDFPFGPVLSHSHVQQEQPNLWRGERGRREGPEGGGGTEVR